MRRASHVVTALGILVSAGAVVSGCASYSVIEPAAIARINEAHEGELLYVAQSLYAGPLYDDDRYRLLHPRRFEELTYLQNAEGEPIAPPPAEEIIPAGTRVRIERIEWPDGDAVFRRPLYTPRYTTWIFLRVARSGGSQVTMERSERHVLLLPGGIADEETFESWFRAALTATDPNPWLLGLDDVQRQAILQKKPAKGMTYEALTASLGFPDRISQTPHDDGHTIEVGDWGPLRVTLKDGLVDSWSQAAAATPTPTSPAPAPAPAPVATTPLSSGT